MRKLASAIRFLACTACLFVLAARPTAAAELQLSEATPWLVKNAGPQQAKGVIYWMNGYTKDPPVFDRFRLPPYFLKTLSQQGWDVINTKVPARRATMMPWELGPQAVDFVRRRVRDLRASGYKRVVVAGHSWGG